MSRAALLAISHGTSSPAGQSLVRQFADDLCATAHRLEITGETHLGHVDVQQPDVASTIEALPSGLPAVVVPLLLSGGHHVKVDLKEAAEAADRPLAVAPALGPDNRLAQLLSIRLEQAQADPDKDVIILGAAGSSDLGAVEDCADMARRLGALLSVEVSVSYLALAKPRLREAIAEARQNHPGRRIVVVSYLLAPGYFQDLLEDSGADLVTKPLLTDGFSNTMLNSPRELIEIVLDRFRSGLEQLGV